MPNDEDVPVAFPGIDFVPVKFPAPMGSRRGLICMSDTITTGLLYSAYLQGIFPWYTESSREPVLWWSPDPRFVLRVEDLHVPKRLERFMKYTSYRYTMDQMFRDVITNCASVKRREQSGTWIGPLMIDSYCKLFEAGIAHSVEVIHSGKLVGGLYGIIIGQVFCGESMFTLEPDSAKSALIHFVRAFADCGGRLVDSQVYTDNIARFGAKNISRDAFLRLEKEYLPQPLTGDLKSVFEKRANGCLRKHIARDF